MSRMLSAGGAILVAVAAAACADRDNPTALADLQVDALLEITTERVETFNEVEIHASVTQGGMAMAMETMQLEIESHDGDVAVMGMEPDGDGYSAHVIFYAAGEPHLLIGTGRSAIAGLWWRKGRRRFGTESTHYAPDPTSQGIGETEALWRSA